MSYCKKNKQTNKQQTESDKLNFDEYEQTKMLYILDTEIKDQIFFINSTIRRIKNMLFSLISKMKIGTPFADDGSPPLFYYKQ